MMNVLTDILCDTSSTMAPQSFKGTLPQNKTSHHNIPPKQTHLHLFDSISQISSIERPLSSVNHSSPNINIFHSSGQIHIPSNIDSGFEERSNASVFSDAFPEIVPSWLTHDFMKVSDSLPSPGILSNVSDIYSTNRENEHLEMLDLGFPSELATHDVVPNNLNRACIDDSQKLLADLPMQRFSNNDSLIIPSFNDISNTHLNISINKNNMQYQKFKQNGHDMDSPRSLINTVLPCENELLHLPLPSNLTDQCLNSTSSPSIMSSSQSQSHPVDVVCDKLPQINLNNLDSLLGNETSLSEIQLLRHEFPNVRLAEDNCNTHSSRACLDNYNPNGNVIPCDAGNILASTISSLPHSHDVSVQVSFNIPITNNIFINENCYSCKEVAEESPIEIIQCFKCKFCDYISIHKCAVSNHINISHSKTSDSMNIQKSIQNNTGSDNLNSLSVHGKNEVHFHQTNSLINSNSTAPVLNNLDNSALISERNINKYSCLQCSCSFYNISEYNSHLLSNHNKSEHAHLSLRNNTSVGYQLISDNNIVLNTPAEKFSNGEGNFVINNISNLQQSDFSNSQTRKIYHKKMNDTQDISHSKMPESVSTSNEQNILLYKKTLQKKGEACKSSVRKNYPKKTDDVQKKGQSKKATSDFTPTNNEKKLSAHKKAWQRKMKRELGSYICEFKGCNVRFRALDNLEYHRKCHSIGESAFACPECGSTFQNWGAVAGHLWRNHDNDMELHACDQCPFRTYSLSRLENLHKRIHKDECLFLCDTCGKSFKNGKQLRNHRVIHNKASKAKPARSDIFKCNICLKGFAAKRFLHFHQSTVHNQIKPFVCNYCDYSASKRSTMNLHMRQHTGEKPFNCDKCSYKTSDHNSLRRHKMRHSGEKPYKCPYCPYSCIQASLYKAHLKKHPGQDEGLIFSCNICKFKSIKQDSYSLHMSEHESINVQLRENSTMDMHSTDEIFPLAEAMDISLCQSDNLISNFNKSKNIQSIFNGFNINMVSVGQQNGN